MSEKDKVKLVKSIVKDAKANGQVLSQDDFWAYYG